jgi:integrase
MPGCRELSNEEISQLIDKGLSNHYKGRFLIQTYLATALRVSEGIRLRIKDIARCSNGTVLFDRGSPIILDSLRVSKQFLKGGKSGNNIKSRDIALRFWYRLAASQYIARYKAEYADITPESFLFPHNTNPSQHISSRMAQHIFSEGISKAKIYDPRNRSLGIHSIRKSACKDYWEASGKDLSITQHRLGHASAATTSLYLNPDKDKVKEAQVSSFKFLEPKNIEMLSLVMEEPDFT